MLMKETTNDEKLIKTLVCLERQQHEQIPAEYQYVKEKVLWKPAKRHKVVHPARYKHVEEHVMVRKARHEKIVHPAQYQVIKERVLVRKEKRVVHHKPAVYKTVKKKVLVDSGKSGWVRVSAAKGGCW